MSHAKVAELVEMAFAVRTCVGQRNHVLDGSRTTHVKMQKGNFEGE